MGNIKDEMPLTNKQLEDELNKIHFKNKGMQDRFNRIKETTWLRQYAKKSKIQLVKIVTKVKKGIKKGKYLSASEYEEFKKGKQIEPHVIKPKIKKKPKVKTTKEDNKAVTVKKGKKKISAGGKVLTRKEKEKVKSNLDTAPSGRKYSYTEIHEGKGSKRAIAYREKNGIKANDYEV